MYWFNAVSIFSIVTVSSELITFDYKQYNELATFATKVFINLSITNRNALIINLENHVTQDEFHSMISKSVSTLTYTNIALRNYSLSFNNSLNFRPDVTVIFLSKENYVNIDEIIFNIELFPLWNVRSKFLLVASDVDEEDSSWVEESFKAFWERQVRHVVLCFWDQGLKISTFNPFYNQFNIEVSSDADVSIILNEKIRNMNGHKIKIFNMNMVYLDRIVETRVNGKVSYLGMDGIFFTSLCNLLSASLEIHNLTEYIDVGSVNMDMDLSFQDENLLVPVAEMCDYDILANAMGVVANMDILDHVYQSERDDMYILVPRASQIPRYLFLFLLVPQDVWMATGSSLVMVSGVMWLLKKGWWKTSKRNVFFDNLRLLLNQPITDQFQKFQLRVLLLSWMIHCLIITTLFQSILMISYISPRFYAEIDTLEDLYKSGLEVYGASLLIKIVRDNLDNEDIARILTPIPRQISQFGFNNQWLDHYMYKKDCGLLVFLEQHFYIKSKPLINKKYHRMRTPIVPYIRAYWVRQDKILFTELVEIMGILEQSGLNQYWKKYNYGIVARDGPKGSGNETSVPEKEEGDMALQLEHLELGFLLLGAGYVVAWVVFVGEVVIKVGKKWCIKKHEGLRM